MTCHGRARCDRSTFSATEVVPFHGALNGRQGYTFFRRHAMDLCERPKIVGPMRATLVTFKNAQTFVNDYDVASSQRRVVQERLGRVGDFSSVVSQRTELGLRAGPVFGLGEKRVAVPARLRMEGPPALNPRGD